MRYSEVKKSKGGRHILRLATSCKKIVGSNTKEYIKRVISEVTVFLLFWLHLDSQYLKTVRKFYLSHPVLLLVVTQCKQTNLKIACYLTFGSFLLFINTYY